MKEKWLLLSFLLLLTACQVEPEPINFGEDQGAYCRMTIVNTRYGGELVTEKGKVYKFDAVECMVNYLRENPGEEYAYRLAIAADTPGELHPVKEMFFLQSHQLPSPMGANVTGFSTREAAESAQSEYGGDIFSWQEVQELIGQREDI